MLEEMKPFVHFLFHSQMTSVCLYFDTQDALCMKPDEWLLQRTVLLALTDALDAHGYA